MKSLEKALYKIYIAVVFAITIIFCCTDCVFNIPVYLCIFGCVLASLFVAEAWTKRMERLNAIRRK